MKFTMSEWDVTWLFERSTASEKFGFAKTCQEQFLFREEIFYSETLIINY